ncbi:MAG: hypothetical protein NXI04_20995 [Planctomycetaceae bacterium]|nr:hypothetical protein [Planctomycetaceae bacterium]
MIDSHHPTDPVTEWDLALFAENGLDDIRRQQVAEFLAEHPQLKAILGDDVVRLPTGESNRPKTIADNERAHGRFSSVSEPTVSAKPSDAGSRDAGLSQAGSSRSVLRRRLFTTASVLAAILLVSTGIEFLGQTKADSPLLREIEESFRDGSLHASGGLTLVWGKLEGLDPHTLSLEDQQLRQYLMAMVLLREAESEFVAKRPVRPGEVVPRQPPLAELTQRAIGRLTKLLPDRPELKPELARAWSLHGRIHFRFAVSVRSQRNIDAASICEAFLRAFELMPENDPQRWRIASSLLKTIYKLTPRHDTAQRKAILSSLGTSFPDFAIDVAKPSESVILELAELILKQAPHSESVRVAQVEVASILTMGSQYGRHSDQASHHISQTLDMAEANTKGASDEFLLVYGQLLGNLADKCRFHDLDQAVRLGRKAHQMLKQLAPDDRADELYTELGWVTARLLISEYRYWLRNPEDDSQVDRMIGALHQTEYGLKHFETLQLAPWEIDVINAIIAGKSQEPDESAEPSRSTAAARILKNYQANQLSDVVIKALREEFASLPAFQKSDAFREFLRAEAAKL